jgi:hypothetical protein
MGRGGDGMALAGSAFCIGMSIRETNSLSWLGFGMSFST